MDQRELERRCSSAMSSKKGSSLAGEHSDHKSDSDSDFEEEDNTGLLDGPNELSLSTPSRNRQMNAGNLDAKIVKALKKQEEKREKRTTRKKEFQELYTRKPKEGEEDPVLVEEIRKARENVGMYTRKTSLEFEESSPIRYEEHRIQLITLLNQVCVFKFPAFRKFQLLIQLSLTLGCGAVNEHGQLLLGLYGCGQFRAVWKYCQLTSKLLHYCLGCLNYGRFGQ